MFFKPLLHRGAGGRCRLVYEADVSAEIIPFPRPHRAAVKHELVERREHAYREFTKAVREGDTVAAVQWTLVASELERAIMGVAAETSGA
jgi:hypothetical protein